MCGPLVIMVGLRFQDDRRPPFLSSLLYHSSRITVYVILGGFVGVIGSFLGLAGDLSAVAGVAGLLLGCGIIVLGMGYLGWLSTTRLEPSGKWLTQAISRVLDQRGVAGVVALGALNGLLPCGLVYSALLVSASTGGAARGAAGMLAFGLGTLPALLVVGMGSRLISLPVRRTMTRLAGVFMVIIGLQIGLRGLSALGVVPHLHVGGLVLW
jgi:sulfite exporter TauE/SafE